MSQQRTDELIRNLTSSVSLPEPPNPFTHTPSMTPSSPPPRKKSSQGKSPLFDVKTVGMYFQLPEATRDKLRTLVFHNPSLSMSWFVNEAIEMYCEKNLPK